MTTLLAGHAAATWALAGLIWTVQLVHYPLFAQVGTEASAGTTRGTRSRSRGSSDP